MIFLSRRRRGVVCPVSESAQWRPPARGLRWGGGGLHFFLWRWPVAPALDQGGARKPATLNLSAKADLAVRRSGRACRCQ